MMMMMMGGSMRKSLRNANALMKGVKGRRHPPL